MIGLLNGGQRSPHYWRDCYDWFVEWRSEV